MSIYIYIQKMKSRIPKEPIQPYPPQAASAPVPFRCGGVYVVGKKREKSRT